MVALLQQLLTDQREMRQRLDAIAQGAIAPRIIVDVLFPPFKTTIQDPAYRDEITITGQWYD